MGSYFSIETIWLQSLNVLLMVSITAILTMGDSLHRFYAVYAIGILAGLLSVLYAQKIPGGLQSAVKRSSAEKFSVIIHAVHDRIYTRFICIAIISISSIMWINISSILYLRDMLKYPDAQIMGFMAAGAIGVAFTVRYWAGFTKKYGSYTTMAGLIAAHSAIAMAWCLLLPDMDWALPLALSLIICGAIFSAGL